MSLSVPEADLPSALDAQQAVEAAYAHELAEIAGHLVRGLPTLVECDKELAPYLFMNVRSRLRDRNLRCIYLDGRPREGDQPGGPMPVGLIGTMIAQLREAVRGAVDRRVVVLPHLDLLTTSQGGLTGEAREVIPLLYENPELVWLGFKDPSFPLPKVIENLFPHRMSILGIARDRLRNLVTQREARKFGRTFNPWQLYKFVSGVNAVRLRRLLSTLEGEDYPADPKQAYRQLRAATVSGALEIPDIDLDKDIGGYAKTKKQLRQEILDVLTKRDNASNPDDVARLEELLPKGMIFWGPPGTGKTYFAKAIATAIGAAITIVSGPELKSKWVGESLPYEEPVLVVVNGVAKKLPIGELVENHRDTDDVKAWTVTDDGRTRLAPVTGFLKHKGPDYIDVLVTETGRQVRVTGGHSLFVRNVDDTLGEVFAEQVVAGETRVAVPLRLVPPETVTELNLLELLSGREDVRVQGYDEQVAEVVETVGVAKATAVIGVDVRKLNWKQRKPLTVAAFEKLVAEGGTEPDAEPLTLYCWHRNKTLPAILPLTAELGEFFGLWAADGCYANTGVRIASNLDQVDKIEALCNGLFGHATRYEKKYEGSRSVDLVIDHTLLRHVMADGLGLQDGSGRKRVPGFVFLAPKPVVAAFLRGYFTGDGSFTGKYIEATTTSRELADDVVTLLQYFGIAARIRTRLEHSGSTSYRVRFVWSKFLRTFADEIGFMDDTRQAKLRAYVDGMTFRRDLQTPQAHITRDVLWDTVVEKRREPYAREHVYDLSVAGTERFIAGFGNVLVHNSEENLRMVFHKARQSAPAIIVFDELDSFATRRGTFTGSGVEHSMVNQLLTEMDGFHKEELVFIVGTTNFVESLDPALLRPGRFEFHLHIPYPDDADRREILKIYDAKMKLQMTEEAFAHAVRRTGESFMTNTGTPFSGDHLNALCRSVARIRLRDNIDGPTTPKEVERGFNEYEEKVDLSEKDSVLVATHEAGHFVVSLFCPHHPAPERVTIQSEMPWAPFYTGYKRDDKRKVGYSRMELLDRLCVLYGGIEAERLLMGDVSTGASGFGSPSGDLFRGTQLARMLVEVCGMSGMVAPLRVYHDAEGERDVHSGAVAEAIDRQVNTFIAEAQHRAAKLLADHKADLVALRDELLADKTIEPDRVATIIADVRAKYAAEFAAADTVSPPTPDVSPEEATPLDKPATEAKPKKQK